MSTLVEKSLAAIGKLREAPPRVHCITNNVAQNFTANVLLACGATPSMTIAIEEIVEFIARADALLVNLGTMDPARTVAINKAVEVAKRQNIPFVLDPVFVQASTSRLSLARELTGLHPSIIRANRVEAEALFNTTSNGHSLEELPKNGRTCLVISGGQDRLIDGNNRATISNGTPLMAKVTAMGCALTGLIAALVAVEDDRLVAATAALLWFNVAGELAAEMSSGPGTFAANFLDALATIETDTIEKRAKIL